MVTEVLFISISHLDIGFELGDHEATSPERYSGRDLFRQHDSCSLSETTSQQVSVPEHLGVLVRVLLEREVLYVSLIT